MFHFVYNADDLYGYPTYAAPVERPYRGMGLRRAYFATLRRAKKLLWEKESVRHDWFFAVGRQVLQDLKRRRLQNSSLAFPPCRVNIAPKMPKKRQAVQFARLIPDKRLELYIEMASNIPEHEFILVGRRDSLSETLYPGYADKLTSTLPSNMTYVESTLRERPDLLQESQVYIYTGKERGIVLTMAEAIAAGCIPQKAREPQTSLRSLRLAQSIGLPKKQSENFV
jgi:glycosyltransferase involved in cell wall biosynthesis